MGVRRNGRSSYAGAVPGRHDDRPASRWGSPWIDIGIWAFVLVATTLTLWYSLGPTPPGPGFDTEMHAAMYLLSTLAILLAIVWRPGRGAGRFDAFTLPVAIAMLVLGALIEIVQEGFAGRDSQFTDWLADAVGVVAAVTVFSILRRALRER